MSNDEWIRICALACMSRVLYEASRPRPAASEIPETTPLLTRFCQTDSLESEPVPDLPPEVEGWKRKELRRFREAQERKWRNWFGAMYTGPGLDK